MGRIFITIILIIFCTVNYCCVEAAEEESINRGALADGVMDIYEYITQKFCLPNAEQPVFKDVLETPYAYRILQAYSSGFMSGMEDGMFYPATYTNREQTAVVMYALIQKLDQEGYTRVLQEETMFEILDGEQISPWAYEAVSEMVNANIMQLDEHCFHPQNSVNMEELITISNAIKKIYAVPLEDRIDFEEFLQNIIASKAN